MNWQNNGSWKEWFEITGADGVDFHSIGHHPEKGDPILPGESYTKEEFFKAKSYPRSDYTFWKLINGEKYYTCFANPKVEGETVTGIFQTASKHNAEFYLINSNFYMLSQTHCLNIEKYMTYH